MLLEALDTGARGRSPAAWRAMSQPTRACSRMRSAAPQRSRRPRQLERGRARGVHALLPRPASTRSTSWRGLVEPNRLRARILMWAEEEIRARRAAAEGRRDPRSGAVPRRAAARRGRRPARHQRRATRGDRLRADRAGRAGVGQARAIRCGSPSRPRSLALDAGAVSGTGRLEYVSTDPAGPVTVVTPEFVKSYFLGGIDGAQNSTALAKMRKRTNGLQHPETRRADESCYKVALVVVPTLYQNL